MKNKSMITTVAGLMICVAAQIASHFITLPDFVFGVAMGAGIGIMITALIKRKKQGVL